jgi:hypothetical protein
MTRPSSLAEVDRLSKELRFLQLEREPLRAEAQQATKQVCWPWSEIPESADCSQLLILLVCHRFGRAALRVYLRGAKVASPGGGAGEKT